MIKNPINYLGDKIFMAVEMMSVRLQRPDVQRRIAGLRARFVHYTFMPIRSIETIALLGFRDWNINRDPRTSFAKALIRHGRFSIEVGHLIFVDPKADEGTAKMKKDVLFLINDYGLMPVYSRLFSFLNNDRRAKLFCILDYLASYDHKILGSVFSAVIRRLSRAGIRESSVLIDRMYDKLQNVFESRGRKIYRRVSREMYSYAFMGEYREYISFVEQLLSFIKEDRFVSNPHDVRVIIPGEEEFLLCSISRLFTQYEDAVRENPGKIARLKKFWQLLNDTWDIIDAFRLSYRGGSIVCEDSFVPFDILQERYDSLSRMIEAPTP